jgi:ABC-type Fe2+-enterobactin transport system substrate-binding protein
MPPGTELSERNRRIVLGTIAFTAGILLCIVAAVISAVIRDENVRVEQRKGEST